MWTVRVLERSSRPLQNVWRSYTSRAHPSPTPQYSIVQAIQNTLTGVEHRNQRRRNKHKRNQKQTPCKDLDETIELAINLNVDPRKPGQSLRGSLALPHGTGKSMQVVVFTENKQLQEAALQKGALHAGGESLVDQIVKGDVSVDSFQRALSVEGDRIVSVLGKKAARLLGPRGLMPNAKLQTLVPEAQLLDTLQQQLDGPPLQYRTEKEGIIHFIVGKASFGTDKLLDNAKVILEEVFAIKPENYGKGKKGSKATGKGTKFVLRAHVSSTQGSSFRVDLRTVDPTSATFMKSLGGDAKAAV